MKSLGIGLLLIGIATAVLGLVLLLSPRIPWLGHLRGNMDYRGQHTSFHFPVVTCIVASVVLTLVLNLILRLFRK